MLKPGDIVLFRNPAMGTFGHTGRIIEVRKDSLLIEPEFFQLRDRVIPLAHVESFWPKGAKNRSLTAARPLGDGHG